MSEKRRGRSLFAQAKRPIWSTITQRHVSFFAGRVFAAKYGIRKAPNSYTNILGRLIDLQPMFESGKVRGVRLLFRLCEENSEGHVRQHHSDRNMKDLSLGPFDTVYQTPVTATVKEAGEEIVFPIGNFENTYAMICENRNPGEENRFLHISFRLET